MRDTYAFVPERCVTFGTRDAPSIDDMAYMRSGWDVRNMRFDESEASGSRLFPEVRDDLADLSDERVTHFIERLKHAYVGVSAH